ncbi:kinesin-like protein KIN-14L isoform X2 [Citrus sinensis]|uniref:kinesin-like protein KIN-14L n=1 Tax=Citrus clementina TaxID=85681 RepID=UPI000CED3C56|nr:kinesin-like protein KIN-14L [Citrus x clementina]XP_052289610.1 kinesin-like protein KIN-14L isoform X2 [Citrus sinensis]
MEDSRRRSGLHDFNLASRKAEESAWRRFEAAEWLENLVGPLGVSSEPSEREFISCLRNGLILCNAINKINPGTVTKVVENSSYIQSFSRESQPPPAYQYFENVRNFLVAVEELKLPAFEASDLERDTLEAGSAAKIVDCILSLKSYHEWKQMSCENGFYKPAKTLLVLQSASRPSRASTVITSGSSRHLDMSALSEKQLPANGENLKLEDLIVKVIAECMIGAKENLDENLLASFHNRSLDSFKLLTKVLSSCSKQLQTEYPELKSMFEAFLKGSRLQTHVTSSPEDLPVLGISQCCRACLMKGNCKHRQLLQMQEKELVDLKDLLSRTKKEFKDLELQLHSDLEDLGNQVQEMSSAALGYHRVVNENRKLYNMVQDLKGNIRVYCRVRPSFRAETKNVIEFIGEDGSLVILDPLKARKEGRKVFQFNHVFGPTATQDDVFKDTQPLIRSVMDGYNVCIFAYGQTGSGKTHTMSGPSGGMQKDRGINYLALEDLFHISSTRKDIINYDIYVQMIEIYNEQVRDLLIEDSSNTKLEIRSCASENGLNLPDATMHSVKSTADVLRLMKLGEVNRAVSSTAINNRSSRSHSVLTIHVHGKDTSGSILRSCLHLVDLAGSERVDKSEVTGDRLKEAQYINKSLSCLGDVITALAQKNSHIPYRNSKLTLLLQDSLGGRAKTLMFAHVSPEVDSFGETVSTLKFAQRVSTVELGAARVNKESNEVMQLKEQIESLKKALANKEAQKAIAVTERTPPRTRRLSIESLSAVKTEKVINSQEKKGTKTPSVPTRARRLSLEGPRYGIKENIQVKVSDSVSKPLQLGSASRQKFDQFQAVSTPYEHWSSNDVSIIDANHHNNVPKSPNFSYRKRAVKSDNRPLISSHQLPNTPEPQISARNEVQIEKQSELTLSTEPRTTNGKGSQIRKSLRTIGKLINGSEKRNQQNLILPTKGAGKINDGNSPVRTSTRSLRRQSLTGTEASGSDRSRRSSLGGKPTESNANDYRNAKTPPPIRPSAQTTKRWM